MSWRKQKKKSQTWRSQHRDWRGTDEREVYSNSIECQKLSTERVKWIKIRRIVWIVGRISRIMNLHNSNCLTATIYGNCQAICFKITFSNLVKLESGSRFVSILYRCDIIQFFKCSVKMLYILISHRFCNTFYSCTALKHCSCLFHTDFFQNISECHSWFFFNIFWQIWFWKEELLSKIVQCNFFIICVNIISCNI